MKKSTVERGTRPEGVALELPPMPEFVGVGRMVAAAVARHHGFGDEQVEDLKIAVSEALTNAVRAHLAAGTGDAVRMSIHLHDDRLVVEVADHGLGFDPDAHGPLGEAPLQGSLEGGLGLLLIRALITGTVIERRDGDGMVIRMTVKREEAPAG
jgi:serine/threonine-protein kinase RsbW